MCAHACACACMCVHSYVAVREAQANKTWLLPSLSFPLCAPTHYVPVFPPFPPLLSFSFPLTGRMYTCSVSPLHTKTFKLQTFKDVDVHHWTVLSREEIESNPARKQNLCLPRQV